MGPPLQPTLTGHMGPPLQPILTGHTGPPLQPILIGHTGPPLQSAGAFVSSWLGLLPDLIRAVL